MKRITLLVTASLCIQFTFAKKLNTEYLWLGVWDKNTGAIRFYERNGFVKFDEHPFYMGDELQTDYLMKLSF